MDPRRKIELLHEIGNADRLIDDAHFKSDCRGKYSLTQALRLVTGTLRILLENMPDAEETADGSSEQVPA